MIAVFTGKKQIRSSQIKTCPSEVQGCGYWYDQLLSHQGSPIWPATGQLLATTNTREKKNMHVEKWYVQ